MSNIHTFSVLPGILIIMKALVTICARKKREDAGLMPAYLRYDAPHVTHTYEEAKRLELPFYILSGKYGIIKGDTPLELYDYYLEDGKVDELGTVMAKQLQTEGITDIVFYTEEKASWVPYTRALVMAAETATANLTYHQLPPA
mgnify:FL=1